MYNINVCIPFSRPNYLEDCLESVCRVTKKEFSEQKNSYISDHIVRSFVINDYQKTGSTLYNYEYMKYYDDMPLILSVNELIYVSNHNIVGHAARNLFLDKITDFTNKRQPKNEWIYFLDDDNILHPDTLKLIREAELKGKKGIIFSQINKDNSLRLAAGKVDVGFIDTAMFALCLDLIRGTRFDENDYCADGKFIKEVYERNKNEFIITQEVGCYYNYLR